jgi:hypothetical protein
VPFFSSPFLHSLAVFHLPLLPRSWQRWKADRISKWGSACTCIEVSSRCPAYPVLLCSYVYVHTLRKVALLLLPPCCLSPLCCFVCALDWLGSEVG